MFDTTPESFVLCTERIVLECECGECLILLGPKEDWYSEGRTIFECKCGEYLVLLEEEADDDDESRWLALINDFGTEELALFDDLDDEARDVRELLRGLEGSRRPT